MCACVSLPYQSVSSVLIAQKIFSLMCSGMRSGREGREDGGGDSFHLASELLREHLSINVSRHGEGSGAGRWFDHTHIHREGERERDRERGRERERE